MSLSVQLAISVSQSIAIAKVSMLLKYHGFEAKQVGAIEGKV